jgi:Pyridine nucleotide-disulphide oxidoreductase
VRFRAPLLTRTKVTRISGRRRVEAVELQDLDSGQRREVPCDLVIFTAGWAPDHELAVLAGAALDRGTLGPAVDPALRTTRHGLFAAGNVLHGAEVADVAALSGRHVAAAVTRHLEGEPWPSSRIEIQCRPPLHWISPNALIASSPGGEMPPRGRFLLRSLEAARAARVEIAQDGQPLWRGRLRRLGPGRSASLPADWTQAVDPQRGPVLVAIR